MTANPFHPSATPKSAQGACYACGAPLDDAGKPCWMCSAEQPVLAAVVETSEPPARAPDFADNPWIIHGLIWSLVISLAAIGYGYFERVYQQGFAYGLAVVPPIVIVLSIALLSRALGKPMHPLVKSLAVIGILFVTVPLALIIAVLVAIQQICFPNG